MADTTTRHDTLGDDGRSAPRTGATGIVNDLISRIAGLVRGEIDLARAEVQENAATAGRAVALLAGALVLILVALNVLAAALAAALTSLGIEAGWSALIVGGALALIGVIMAMKGKSDLKATSLAPTRTAENLRHDARAVREGVR